MIGWKKTFCCYHCYYVIAVWLCVVCEIGYAWMNPPLSQVQVRVGMMGDSRSGLLLRMIADQEEDNKKTKDEWMDISKDMRIKELQQELKEMGISYSDCFDRESLVRKWLQSKQQPPLQTQDEHPVSSSSSKVEETSNNDNNSSSSNNSNNEMSQEEKEGILSELRSMRVKELRTACAEANIRWANMIEKEDLVQALWNHKKETSMFSVSGRLIPGDVVDINDDIFKQETSSPSNTILVLDVYATWCGPCQLMAPHLKQAAQEWGTNVRVAKLDSDKYPLSAGKLNVGGLPTIILFDKSTGQEIKRQEGALMKDGLLQLVQPYL